MLEQFAQAKYGKSYYGLSKSQQMQLEKFYGKLDPFSTEQQWLQVLVALPRLKGESEEEDRMLDDVAVEKYGDPFFYLSPQQQTQIKDFVQYDPVTLDSKEVWLPAVLALPNLPGNAASDEEVEKTETAGESESEDESEASAFATGAAGAEASESEEESGEASESEEESGSVWQQSTASPFVFQPFVFGAPPPPPVAVKIEPKAPAPAFARVKIEPGVLAPAVVAPRPVCPDEVKSLVSQYVSSLSANVSKERKQLESLDAYLDALEDLRKKLTQEQSVNCQELQNVYEEAVRTRAPKPFLDLVTNMVKDSAYLTGLKLKLNEVEWREHETRLKERLSAVPLPGLAAQPERKRPRPQVQFTDVQKEPGGAGAGLGAVAAAAAAGLATPLPEAPAVQPPAQLVAKKRKTQPSTGSSAQTDKKVQENLVITKYAQMNGQVLQQIKDLNAELQGLPALSRQEIEQLNAKIAAAKADGKRLEAAKLDGELRNVKLGLNTRVADFKQRIAALQNQYKLNEVAQREEIKQIKKQGNKSQSGGTGQMSGGARRQRKQLRKALKYCGCRSNAYYQSLLQKLMRDRQRHENLMKELHYHAIKLLGGAAPMTQMLNTMVHDQKIYGARRTQLDANQWSNLTQKIKGGGCGYWLRAGGCCVTKCE